MTQASLFSGIGGFDLASSWMGWENIFHCEINPFCRKVLKYHFPDSISYEDIKKTNFSIHRGRIDILTGGFPCQPFSVAGKQQGTADNRYLWPEMLRVIQEVSPRYIVGENVPGLLNWDGGMVFEQICTDLENCGYEIQPVILPACGLNAPHRRERVWFVAHTTSELQQRHEPRECGSQRRQDVQPEHGTSDTKQPGTMGENEPVAFSTNTRVKGMSKSENSIYGLTITTPTQDKRQEPTGNTWDGRTGFTDGNSGVITDTGGAGWQEQHDAAFAAGTGYGARCGDEELPDWRDFPTQSPLCGGDDGISDRLDATALFNRANKPKHALRFPKWRNESIKAYGNAIVPQVALQIFKAIAEIDAKFHYGDCR